MNETINTAAAATTVAAEVINNASEVIIEANEAVIHVTAKSGIIARVVNTTGGKVAVGVVAVAAIAAASHYGWKKFQSYKAGKKAKAFCEKTAEEVKKAAEEAAE